MTARWLVNPTTASAHGVSEAGWRQVAQSVPFMLGVIAILASGALITLTLHYLYSQTVEAGKDLTESVAHIMEEQITRTLQGVDLRLQSVANSLERLEPQERISQEAANEFLREQFKALPYVRVAYVINAQGRVSSESSSRAGNIGLDLSDREYFQIYRQRPQTEFFVGTPVRGRTSNVWTVSASRPLKTRNGDFAGIIVAALDPAYFDKQWRSIDLGDGGSIALFRRNGLLLMRSPFDDEAMGKLFNKGPVFREMIQKDPMGSLQATSAIDGKFRTYAYRTLSAQPDLVVLVGQSVDLILAPWLRLAALVITVWLVASVAIIALCVFLGRAWRLKEKSEANAQHTAQRLALATDAASIGIWDWSIDREDQWYATPTYFTALGYDPQEGFANRAQWFERLHPDDKAKVDSKIQAVLAGGELPYEYEARILHADGSYRWVSVVGRVLARDQNGKPTRLMGVRIDITARKRAEVERLQGLERITDAFVSLDKNWCYTYVNKKAGQMFDREPAQLIGKHIWTEFPEGIDQKFHMAYQKAMAEQQPTYLEAYYPPYKRWFENYIYPSPDGLSIYFHDVTDRKLAEQAIVEREQRLRDLINGMGPAILVGLTTPEGILLEANHPALAAAGLKLDDVIGKPLEDTFWVNYSAESKNQIRDAVVRGAQGISSRFDMQIRGLDDQVIIIDFSMQPMYDGAGKIIFLVPSASVITERKLAEDALRKSEARYRTLFEHAPDGIVIADRQSFYIDANPSLCRMLGLTRDELIGLHASDIVVPSEVPNIDAALHAIKTQASYHREWRFRRKDGLTIDADVLATEMPDGNLLAVIRDTTVRKQVELALQESEERYRLLVDQSPYAIGVHQDGKIVMTNRASLVLFGATRSAALIGKPILELIHPDHRNEAQDRIRRMLGGELGLYPAEDSYLKLDGSVFDVEVSAAPFVYKGRPAIQVIALDISKRKQAEAELRLNRAQLKTISRRVLEVQEAERRRVAVELHDELGQALTAIKINLCAREILQGQSLAELNTENLRIVEDALQQVRRMALTLRPSVLDDLGLKPALRWLVDQAAEHNGFTGAFHSRWSEMRLTPEIEITFFRIAQAALTNVVRHAQARHVTLDLFEADDALVLTVKDDGLGFDLQTMRERAKAGGSIGLLGMQERASLIGGKLDIESTPGHGSILRLSCPLRMLGEST